MLKLASSHVVVADMKTEHGGDDLQSNFCFGDAAALPAVAARCCDARLLHWKTTRALSQATQLAPPSIIFYYVSSVLWRVSA